MIREASWTAGVFEGITPGGPAGGIVSDGGFGSGADKSASASWGVSYRSRWELEALRRSSWSAKRVVEVPVEDSFAKWRAFTAEGDDRLEERMREAEDLVGAREKLAEAWIAARLHGTACVVMVTAEADMMEELVPDRIRPGDLRNLVVVDHWSMAVPDYHQEWDDPMFGEPVSWNISTRFGQKLEVHPSRVLLFYGLPPLTMNGGSDDFGRVRGWWAGTSVLESVIKAVNSEELSVSATAQGLMENAMMILKSEGLSMKRLENDAEARERMMEINRSKGLSLMLLDADDEAQRLSSQVSGAAPALTVLGKRLAWAAGVPEARFLGMPSAGFSSSEPEHLAYSEHIRSLQEKHLVPVLKRLDPVLARNAGLSEPPMYEWVPLVTLAEERLAATAKLRVDVARAMKEGGLATLEETRALLRESEYFENVIEEEIPDELEESEDDGGGDGQGVPPGADEGESDGGGEGESESEDGDDD